MRDVTANSHETPIDLDEDEVSKQGFVIVWLGDKKERNLTDYFNVSETGWYAIGDNALLPFGPFDTSEQAFNAFRAYLLMEI